MSARNETPHFMKATEASRNQSSPLLNHTGHSAPPALNSSVGKTRSLFSSASKKLSYRGWKDHSSTARSSIGLRISSPFSFQKLKDTKHTASESGDKEQEQQPRSLSCASKAVERPCQSPLDKPLPRVPTDIERSDSPINGLSLIDATEKPLFRSLSPSESSDWPALSPEKQGLVETGNMQARPQQVSLGESVIERVRKLDLNDAEELLLKAKERTNTTPASITGPGQQDAPVTTAVAEKKNETHGGESISDISTSYAKVAMSTREAASKTTQNALKPKSAIPQLRQTKTSELRKRLSSTPLVNSDCKKPRVGSNHSKTLAHQSSSHESSDHNGSSKKQQRHRSQSRHRVTAQGSPYVVARAVPVRCNNTARESVQSALNLVDDFSPVTAYSLTDDLTDSESRSDTSRSTVVKELLFALEGHRKSSIPIAVQRTRKRLSQDPQSADEPAVEVAKSLSSHFHNAAHDGDVDTDGEVKRGRRSKRSSHVDRVSTGSIRDGHCSTPKKSKGTQGTDVVVSQDVIEHFPKGSPGGLSITATIYGEEDGEKFKIKPLSRSAPKYGAKLRVSESANDFLLGRADEEANTSKSKSCGKRDSRASVTRPLDNQNEQTYPNEPEGVNPPTGIKSEEGRSGCGSQIDTKEMGQVMGQPLNPTDKNTDQVENHKVGPVSLSQHHVTSAPPVKPGTPVDDSPNIGWPFDETVVLPFKYVEPKVGSPEPDSVLSPQITQSMGTNPVDDTAPISTQRNEDYQGMNEGHEYEPTKHDIWTPTTNEYLINKKPHEPACPPRMSSRNAIKVAARDTPDLKERFHQYVGHEPPPIPERSMLGSTISPLMRNAKSTLRGSRPPQTSHRHQDKDFSSPPANPNSLSTGKSVINNIKGLFHKRSAVGDEGMGDRKASENLSKSTLKPLSFESPVPRPHLQPRSPRVKNTNPSLLERRQARLNELDRPFLKHRNVMTVSTTFPIAKHSMSSDGQSHNASLLNSNADNSTSKLVPVTGSSIVIDQHSSNEPVELAAATNMVYDVLNRAQDELRTGHKLHLIELSKLMVQMLHTARDAEKAKEEARQCASRAEVECMKTRKDILEITTLVGKMLGNSGET